MGSSASAEAGTKQQGSERCEINSNVERATLDIDDFDVEASIAELRNAEGDGELACVDTEGNFFGSRFELVEGQIALIAANKARALAKKEGGQTLIRERTETNREEALERK